VASEQAAHAEALSEAAAAHKAEIKAGLEAR